MNKEQKIQKQIDELRKEKEEIEDKKWRKENKKLLEKYKKLTGKIFLKHRKSDDFINIYKIKSVRVEKSKYREGDVNLSLEYIELYFYKNNFSISESWGSGDWSNEILKGEYKIISQSVFNRYLNKCIKYIEGLK